MQSWFGKRRENSTALRFDRDDKSVGLRILRFQEAELQIPRLRSPGFPTSLNSPATTYVVLRKEN
ncbi:MAG: hypothetical protein WCD57_13935, partial [Acidobacteriaceae bacterium]